MKIRPKVTSTWFIGPALRICRISPRYSEMPTSATPRGAPKKPAQKEPVQPVRLKLM